MCFFQVIITGKEILRFCKHVRTGVVIKLLISGTRNSNWEFAHIIIEMFYLLIKHLRNVRIVRITKIVLKITQTFLRLAIIIYQPFFAGIYISTYLNFATPS
jgi:hypothetical protein